MSAGDGKSRWEQQQEIKKLIKVGQEMGLPIKDNGDFSFVGVCGAESTNLYEEAGLQRPPAPGEAGGHGLFQMLPPRRIDPASFKLPSSRAALESRRRIHWVMPRRRP